jgi:hypothetical protein
MRLLDLCLIRSFPAGEPPARLGVPLLDEYLRFLAGRCRPNTVLAAAYDLKVFITVVGKQPEQVRPADVLAFVTAQRAGHSSIEAVRGLPSRPSRVWRCMGVRSSWSGSGRWARASPLVPAISAPSSPSSISIRCGSCRHKHDGCRVAEMAAALGSASVIVTATGFDGVLGEQQLSQVAEGAILVNVGHSDREIDVDWLDRHPSTPVRRHLERFELHGRRVYLLNRGSLVNPRSRARDRRSPVVRSFRGDHAARARCHPERADRRSAERRAALPASAGGPRGAGARHRLRLIDIPARDLPTRRASRRSLAAERLSSEGVRGAVDVVRSGLTCA